MNAGTSARVGPRGGVAPRRGSAQTASASARRDAERLQARFAAPSRRPGTPARGEPAADHARLGRGRAPEAADQARARSPRPPAAPPTPPPVAAAARAAPPAGLRAPPAVPVRRLEGLRPVLTGGTAWTIAVWSLSQLLPVWAPGSVAAASVASATLVVAAWALPIAAAVGAWLALQYARAQWRRATEFVAAVEAAVAASVTEMVPTERAALFGAAVGGAAGLCLAGPMGALAGCAVGALAGGAVGLVIEVDYRVRQLGTWLWGGNVDEVRPRDVDWSLGRRVRVAVVAVAVAGLGLGAMGMTPMGWRAQRP